jgi:chromosome segregation ATPase
MDKERSTLDALLELGLSSKQQLDQLQLSVEKLATLPARVDAIETDVRALKNKIDSVNANATGARKSISDAEANRELEMRALKAHNERLQEVANRGDKASAEALAALKKQGTIRSIVSTAVLALIGWFYQHYATPPEPQTQHIVISREALK